MNLRICRSFPMSVGAATSLLAVFAIFPAGLAAQRRTSDDRRQQDVRITILQTTDLHHHANGTDHLGLDVNPLAGTAVTGAYARISTYVNFVRLTAGHPVVLVDSGDWTMGTLYDLTLSSKPLALFFLSAMRYDCVTLGNHELDY